MPTIVNISHLSMITWSHLALIVRNLETSAERDFYLAATARDQWTVQRLRQEIKSTRQLESQTDRKSQIFPIPNRLQNKRSRKSQETKE